MGKGASSSGRKRQSRAAGSKLKEKTITIRKSCDFCNKRKKKCDGDGLNRCSCCRDKHQEKCVYSRRQPQKPRPPRVKVETQSAPSAPSPTFTRVGAQQSSTALEHIPSIKRCRWSTSPATGLVGMQENAFLSDFFGCMGFLPLTCQSTIREAMMKLMFSQTASPHFASRDITLCSEENSMDTLVPALGGDVPAPAGDPSTCMFWCAVALGGLAKGMPVDLVARYIKVAKCALEDCSETVTPAVARAWAVMAYLYGFCGETNNFHECQRQANALLQASAEIELTDQLEFLELVRHADGISMFYGNSVLAEDVELYLQHSASHPQMGDLVTESGMCQFVIQSYHRFGQAFWSDVSEGSAGLREQNEESNTPGENKSSLQPYNRLSTEGRANVVVISGEEAIHTPILSGNMTKMMDEAMPEYTRLESAVDRTSVVLKARQEDVAGSVERISRCVEVLVRYPGICRFSMGLHISHLLILALAFFGERELYEKLRAAYNPMHSSGTPPIPPFEEWQGISSCCDHIYCRSIQARFESKRPAPPSPACCGQHAAAATTESYIPEKWEGLVALTQESPKAYPNPGNQMEQTANTFGYEQNSSVSSDDIEDELADSMIEIEGLDPIATAAAYLSPEMPTGMKFECVAGNANTRHAPMLARHDVGKAPFWDGMTKGWVSPRSDISLTDNGRDWGGRKFEHSAAELADMYLLPGSNEESFQQFEEIIANDSFIDSTHAMLPQLSTTMFC